MANDFEDAWEDEEPLEEVEDGEKGEKVPAAVDEEEDTDLFSDWNVPSWQELIASLYRPDR